MRGWLSQRDRVGAIVLDCELVSAPGRAVLMFPVYVGPKRPVDGLVTRQGRAAQIGLSHVEKTSQVSAGST